MDQLNIDAQRTVITDAQVVHGENTNSQLFGRIHTSAEKQKARKQKPIGTRACRKTETVDYPITNADSDCFLLLCFPLFRQGVNPPTNFAIKQLIRLHQVSFPIFRQLLRALLSLIPRGDYQPWIVFLASYRDCPNVRIHFSEVPPWGRVKIMAINPRRTAFAVEQVGMEK